MHPKNSNWSCTVQEVQHHNSKNCQTQGTTYCYQMFDLRMKFTSPINNRFPHKVWKHPYTEFMQRDFWGLCYLKHEMVWKQQCFFPPAVALAHALPKACLRTCKKPSSGSSKGCLQRMPKHCIKEAWRLQRSFPMVWHLMDKFAFHFHPSQYFGFSVSAVFIDAF